MFGNYAIDFLFILGDIFNLAHHSSLYTVYTKILQKVISASIELKEKDTQGLILREDLYQLLQPAIHQKSCFYDSFTLGDLHHVSRYTYGIYFKKLIVGSGINVKSLALPYINYEVEGTAGIIRKGSNLAVLQKGQFIYNTEPVKNVKFIYPNIENNRSGQHMLEIGNNMDLTLKFNIKKLLLFFIRVDKIETFGRHCIERVGLYERVGYR